MAGLTTSALGASLPITGFTLQVNTSNSPSTPFDIANVQDYNRAQKSTVVMVTNVGDQFVRRQPTIVDPGAPTFKVFYIPMEQTHHNGVNGGTVPPGLIYLQINRLLREWVANYPADLNGNTPSEAYAAFVTDFGLTGKVAGVFEAQCSLGISDQAPFFP